MTPYHVDRFRLLLARNVDIDDAVLRGLNNDFTIGGPTSILAMSNERFAMMMMMTSMTARFASTTYESTNIGGDSVLAAAKARYMLMHRDNDTRNMINYDDQFRASMATDDVGAGADEIECDSLLADYYNE